jgi:ubiquinone/menaquinone biosynthesis C-methylase UbiE
MNYDPARYMDVKDAEEAMNVIVSPTEHMTAEQRWEDETPELMQIMKRHIAVGSTVLDYGCGIGRLSSRLIFDRICNVVGVDISINMRAMAVARVRDSRFVTMDPLMFDVLVRADTFDAAIAIWALQHCFDLDQVLNRISRSLKLGSKLVVVNNLYRCIPVENGDWLDDGVDVHQLILDSGFQCLVDGVLSERIAPGWMQDGTFWAVYRRM